MGDLAYRSIVWRISAGIAFFGLLAFGPRATGADARLTIPNATVNGKPIRLVFDTGAGGELYLLRATAERLGLKVKWPDPNLKVEPGKVSRGVTERCTLTLMDRTFSNIEIAVYDNPLPLSGVDGIMGWSVWKEDVVTLKLGDGKMELGTEVPAEARGWQKLPLAKDIPTLGLVVGGAGNQAMILEIDTGNADGVSLPSDAWDRWRTEHPDHLTGKLYFMPGAGLIGAELGWADQLPIDGLVLNGVPVREANEAEEADTGKERFAGSLGLAALGRLDMVIDGKSGVAYLRPRQDPPRPYDHNRLGAIFDGSDSKIKELVAHVVKGSPAYRAGLRSGDALLKIDALDMTAEKTKPELDGYLDQWSKSGPGFQSVLIVRRSSQILSIPVTFENILGPMPSAVARTPTPAEESR